MGSFCGLCMAFLILLSAYEGEALNDCKAQTPKASEAVKNIQNKGLGEIYGKTVPGIVLRHLSRQCFNEMNIGEQTAYHWLTEVKEDKTGSSRKKRSVAFPYFDFPNNQWPLNAPIHYVFQSGQFTNEQKAMFRSALDEWESKTCLSFEEGLPSNPGETYLNIKTGTGCISFVGKAEKREQEFFLNAPCFQSRGPLLRVIANAVGLWEEIQHPDRNDFVSFVTADIYPYEAGNLVPLPPQLLDTQGIAYDYTSITHHHQRKYSIGGKRRSIVTRLPVFQRTIGQEVEVSFNDAKLINKLYCASACEDQPPLKCQNSGYQDPGDCTKCRCPDGYAGTTCEDLQGEADYIGKPCGGHIVVDGTEQEITSPDYYDGYYNQGQYCAWSFETANPSKQIEFWFDPEDAFGIVCSTNEACQDWVEIRFERSLYMPGARWCCADIHVNSVRSEGNKAQVIFKALFDGTLGSSMRRGFRLRFKAYPDDIPPACSQPCENGGSCIVGECVCVPGYTGSACEEDIDECEVAESDDERCFNDGLCMDGINSYSCDCTSTGYTGIYCTEEINECASNPCLNEGTCLDALKGYICDCPRGYTGKNCEIDIDDCASVVCDNGGSCVDEVNAYHCDCVTGYEGDHCEILTVDGKCSMNPCKNGGTCQAMPGYPGFICHCPAPFEGDNCERAYCGGCNLNPGEMERPCYHTGETRQTMGTCSKLVKSIIGYRCIYYQCFKTVPVGTCCDNAKMAEVGTMEMCVATGWTNWTRCSFNCGGCGRRNRYQYDVRSTPVLMYSESWRRIYVNKNVRRLVKFDREDCGFQKCTTSLCRGIDWFRRRCQCPCCRGYTLSGNTCVPYTYGYRQG